MTRRSWLWLLGGIALALLMVLGALDMRMTDTGGTGIIGFELAGSEQRAHEILTEWGTKGHDAARLSLWLDYPYIVANAAFLTLAVRALRDGAARRGQTALAKAGAVVAAAPIVGGACDAFENVGLLLALGRHGGNAAPLLATIFASVKFLLLAVVLTYLLAALVAKLRKGPATAG